MMDEVQLPESIDLPEEELPRFKNQLAGIFMQAKSDRIPLVDAANEYERVYNLDPYKNEELPFENSLSVRLPLIATRVDGVAAELSGAFDRDDSPIFKCVPQSQTTLEIAGHAEKQIHEILRSTDAMRQYRLAIKRALKVGTGFLATEVVARPVAEPDGTVVDSENTLQIRSPKLQDMYIYPIAIRELRDAAFVGERFQLPMWRFREYAASGWYQIESDAEGNFPNLAVGSIDSDTGISEDLLRIGVSNGNVSMGNEADLIDLVSGWFRYKAKDSPTAMLFNVVFLAADPTMILRLKVNPYTLLDQAPYVALMVDEGDGTIFGRAYPKLLGNIAQVLDSFYMLRIEHLKRTLSQVWTVKVNSDIWKQLQNRRSESFEGESPAAFNTAPASGVAHILPDEIFPVRDHDEIKGLPLAQSNPTVYADEQRLQQYLDDATVSSAPLGGIRSAFEVRQAAQKSSSKMKSYLKVIASTGLLPHIAQVQAMCWEFLMDNSLGLESIKFMEYGDTSVPVTIADYFRGISFQPSGTTTSADEVLALQSTADAMNQFVPLILQVPGVVPDPVVAIRELMKARLKALRLDNMEQIMGLSEPTQADLQKAMQYLQLRQQVTGGEMPPQNSIGADGGISAGLQSVDEISDSVDRTGGAQTGVKRGTF